MKNNASSSGAAFIKQGGKRTVGALSKVGEVVAGEGDKIRRAIRSKAGTKIVGQR